MSQAPKPKRRKTTQVGEQKEDKQSWNFYVQVKKKDALQWTNEQPNAGRGYRFALDLSQSNASFSIDKKEKKSQQDFVRDLLKVAICAGHEQSSDEYNK